MTLRVVIPTKLQARILSDDHGEDKGRILTAKSDEICAESSGSEGSRSQLMAAMQANLAATGETGGIEAMIALLRDIVALPERVEAEPDQVVSPTPATLRTPSLTARA